MRDWRGMVVLAGSKKVNTIIPLQAEAEAEALLWAVQLAMEKEVPKAVLEGDFKTCIYAISQQSRDRPWRIKNYIEEVVSISNCFSECSFCWVNRADKPSSPCFGSLVLI